MLCYFACIILLLYVRDCWDNTLFVHEMSFYLKISTVFFFHSKVEEFRHAWSLTLIKLYSVSVKWSHCTWLWLIRRESNLTASDSESALWGVNINKHLSLISGKRKLPWWIESMCLSFRGLEMNSQTSGETNVPVLPWSWAGTAHTWKTRKLVQKSVL